MSSFKPSLSIPDRSERHFNKDDVRFYKEALDSMTAAVDSHFEIVHNAAFKQDPTMVLSEQPKNQYDNVVDLDAHRRARTAGVAVVAADSQTPTFEEQSRANVENLFKERDQEPHAPAA